MTDEQRYAASQSYEDGENVGDAADHVQGIGSAAGRISPGRRGRAGGAEARCDHAAGYRRIESLKMKILFITRIRVII